MANELDFGDDRWTDEDRAIAEELDEIERAARFEPHYSLEEIEKELAACRIERASLRELGVNSSK